MGSSNDDEIVNMITGFFSSLECVPSYQEAICFVHMESNMSWPNANRVGKILKNRGGTMKCVPVSRDPTGAGREGSFTSDLLKEHMVLQMKDALSNGRIKIAKDFVARKPESIYAKMKQQFKVFRQYLKRKAMNGSVSTSGQSNFKGSMWKYDGKLSANTPDDLCMVTLMGHFYAKMTEEHPRFKELAATNAWLGQASVAA